MNVLLTRLQEPCCLAAEVVFAVDVAVVFVAVAVKQNHQFASIVPVCQEAAVKRTLLSLSLPSKAAAQSYLPEVCGTVG